MPTHATFTTVWTITQPQYEDIHRKNISKIILLSYKNVVFRFRLELIGFVNVNDAQRFAMVIFYEDGPLRSLDDCMLSHHLRTDTKMLGEFHWESYQLKRGGCVTGRVPVRNTSMHINKKKNDCDASNDLHYSITIAIPLTAFDYKAPKPQIEQRRDWLTGIFKCLEDVEKSKFSNVRFVGVDGGTFYCHKIIVGQQSKELETMLDNPMSEAEKSGVFCFPSLDTRSLHSILEYLYTGEYDLLTKLPAPLVIQVADFSEQYALKALKEASICQLWEIIVENPKDAVAILRFADLHPEAKYLKDRAMDVIMENFEKLSMHPYDFLGGNIHDLQGNRLTYEFMLYTTRRLWITRL